MLKQLHQLASIALAICLCRSAAGYATIEPQDTESMAVESRLVLEGTIVRTWKGDGGEKEPRWVTRLKISEVIAGPFDEIEPCDGVPSKKMDMSAVKLKPGGEIDVGAVGGQITEDLAGGKRRPLAPDDMVVVFLRHKDDRNLHSADTSADWITLGHRYIKDENAYVFKEGRGGIVGPGPHLTVTRLSFPDVDPLTRHDFIARIKTACAEAPKLRSLIDHATRDDTERLLDICRARKAINSGEIVESDHWPEWAGSKLEQVGDAKLLVDTLLSKQLTQETNFRPNMVMAMRADCRELVLERLEKSEVPLDRWDNALDLFEDGRNYQSDLRHADDDHAARPHGGRLAARLAKIATTTGDPKNAEKAFSEVRECVMTPGYPSFAALDEDLAAAADVIVDAWPKLDARRRFDAAITMTYLGEKQLARVSPGSGPFLTVLSEGQSAQPLDRTRRLRVKYAWRNFLRKSEPDASLSLVCRSLNDQREFEQPFQSRWPQMRENGGRDYFGMDGFDIDLPPGVQAGRYVAFIRVRQSGKIIGDGFGCEVDVPGKA